MNKTERQLNDRQRMEHDKPVSDFIELVGNLRVSRITPTNVRAYKDAEVERGMAALTINGRLSVLRRVFGYAVDNAIISANPATNIRAAKNKQKERPRKPWSPAELQRLVLGPVHAEGDRPNGGQGEARILAAVSRSVHGRPP
ncbi:MAG: hypothetical protein WD470_07375 [Rhodospirillaceae bacterium]